MIWLRVCGTTRGSGGLCGPATMGGFFAGIEKARQKEAARRAGSATTTTPAGSRPPPTATSASSAALDIYAPPQSGTGGTPVVVRAFKKVFFNAPALAFLIMLVPGLYLTLGNLYQVMAGVEEYREKEENASPPPLPPTMPNEEPPATEEIRVPLMQLMIGVVILLVACYQLLSKCARFARLWRHMSVAQSSAARRVDGLGALSSSTSAD